jgi:alcohol dehydrogenase
MENFIFQMPTKIIFGKDTESAVGAEAAEYSKRVLLHYGGGSIKRSGLFDRVMESLREAGLEVYELGGVKPNPRLELVREGIRMCREKEIGLVLAVGGGSVIDSAKGIAAGVEYNGDVWDLYRGTPVRGALPVGTILTIAAAGSETSDGSVVTKEDENLKRFINSVHIVPKFSILNPELTATLSEEQTMTGIADIFAHLIERYFTQTEHVDFSDHLLEGAIRSLVKNALELKKDLGSYDTRVEIMWAGSMAHNNILGVGRIQDWASHLIEHELSGFYDVAHGAGLAVVIPAWMEYVYKENSTRFAQYAYRVWDVELDFMDLGPAAVGGIEKTREFFRAINMPRSLKDLGIPDDRLEEMAECCVADGPVGNFKKLNKEDVLAILKSAADTAPATLSSD